MAGIKGFINKLIQWTPLRGGLVSDIAPEDITGGGLYVTRPETGAMNVRAIGEDTNVTPDYEVIKGNYYIYEPQAVVAQNRVFRVFLVYFATNTYTFTLKTPSGVVLFTTASAGSGANVTAAYNLIVSELVTSLTGASQSYNAALLAVFNLTSSTTGYFDIEITEVLYWDYVLTAVTTNPSGSFPSVITVIQEAYDISMIGNWLPIGSDDRTGDEWHHWTTRNNLPTSFTITDATNAAGLIRIETSIPHNILTGFSVQIINVGGVPNANGVWIATFVDATHIDLQASVFAGAYTPNTGTITPYIYGLGEIGVGVKNENDQTWVYTRLLRSKEFNFSTLKQIDCRVKQKQDLNKADYFTDNYNPYRVFYYKGAFITDGGLAINGGNYSYGSIAIETLLDQTAAGFDITFINQIQIGGNVRSGNWRYAVRFATEAGLSFTNWGLLTNSVAVAGGSETGSGYNFFGLPSGATTAKQNVLQITNPIPGLFKYVEIAAINYLDAGFTGEVIGRYVLTGAATQQIIHTGIELGVTDLDIGTLNHVLLSVKHGRNIELLNNRLVKSHLTLNPLPDLTEFFEGFTYAIRRSIIPGVSTGSFINNSLIPGEYMLSDNVYKVATLMINERYRWGFMAEFKDGTYSLVYPGQDIIINTDATQQGCTAALPGYDLTTGAIGFQVPYSFYIEWAYPNLDQVVNGIQIRDLIRRILVMRVPVKLTNARVKASGFIIPAVGGDVGDNGGSAINFTRWSDPNSNLFTNQFGEFPFVAGVDEFLLSGVPIDYGYGDITPIDDFTVQRNYCSFYSPDLFFGHTAINPQANDILRNYGQPLTARSAYIETGAPTRWDNDYYLEVNGDTGTFQDVIIAEGANIDKGGGATLGGNPFSKKLVAHFFSNAGLNGAVFHAPAGIVLYSASNFNILTGNPERAIYLAQYIREIAANTQYGTTSESKYEYVGGYLDIDTTTPATGTFNAKEGDCFNQATYFKERYPVIAPDVAAGDVTWKGMGQGFRFYSINRVNTQMRNPNAGSGTPTAFPASAAPSVQTWLNNTFLESLSYNEGYTIRNEITSYAAFDPNAEYQTDWGNVIWWSQPEAEGSVTDNLRLFLPLDIKFEDYTFGYITDFRNVNEQAVVIQQRKIIKEYFNDNAVLTTQEGSEVITGDGGIMNQKGQTITTFGSSNKWSVIVGKNIRGNQMVYCIDAENKAILRYGYNGTDVISQMQNIKAFCANNFQFVINKDTPAHNEGIHGVSNHRFSEIIWTFSGWKSEIPDWDLLQAYVVGDAVVYLTTNFEEIPAIYQCILNHTSENPTSTQFWEKIATTDNRYYSFYTLVYDELKDVFQLFMTPKPRIYAKYRDHYLDFRRVGNTGKVYESNKGTDSPPTWFDDGTTRQTGDAFFDAVFNEPKNIKKTFSALKYMSDTAPDRTEVTTQNQYTYMNSADFETREDEHDVSVMNDATIKLIGQDGAVPNPFGDNNIDTSKLWGKWAIVRTIMRSANKVNSIILKLRYRARTP